MSHIEITNDNEWVPEREDLDYTANWIGALVAHDAGFLYFVDDDYRFQITEDNAICYRNDTNEEMNGTALIDPRDRNAWWWFQGITAEYEDLYEPMSPHALHIISILPRPEVVRNFLRLAQYDLEDYPPETWTK